MSPTVTPERIARLISEAPGWARVGITAPSERLREQAAAELGQWLCDHLDGSKKPTTDAGQIPLPL